MENLRSAAVHIKRDVIYIRMLKIKQHTAGVAAATGSGYSLLPPINSKHDNFNWFLHYLLLYNLIILRNYLFEQAFPLSHNRFQSLMVLKTKF